MPGVKRNESADSPEPVLLQQAGHSSSGQADTVPTTAAPSGPGLLLPPAGVCSKNRFRPV